MQCINYCIDPSVKQCINHFIHFYCHITINVSHKKVFSLIDMKRYPWHTILNSLDTIVFVTICEQCCNSIIHLFIYSFIHFFIHPFNYFTACQSTDYPHGLMAHTNLISSGSFSEISSFMPGLKSLMQIATQLRV